MTPLPVLQPAGLKTDGEFQLVGVKRQHGELVWTESEKTIESMYSCERTAGHPRAEPGLIGLALERGPDASQLARIVGLRSVDAVGDEDGAAARLEEVVGPADDGEATRDRGVDQHARQRSSLTVGERSILEVLLDSSLAILRPGPDEELVDLLGARGEYLCSVARRDEPTF